MKHLSVLLVLAIMVVAHLSAQSFQPTDAEGNPIPVVAKNKLDKDKIVPGQVIVKFRDGVLDTETLEANQLEFSMVTEAINGKVESDVFKDKNLKNELDKLKVEKLKRVVTKLRPHHQKSISRSGEEIDMPDWYNLMLLEVPVASNINLLCQQLSKMEGVEYAEPDYLYSPGDSPANDTDYSQQQSFEQSNDIDIDAARAWDFTTGSYNVKVGVIDSGIDFNHPDLGNGVWNVEGAKVRGGWDYYSNDSNPDDEWPSSHGTKCAGIIGALRNNNRGIAGLAGGNGGANIGVQLFAFKVGGTEGSYSSSKIVDAIIEASSFTTGFGYGCHILNNSYGSNNYSNAQLGAVATAAQNRVTFVAGKGNDGVSTPFYPADYNDQWVLSVGASDNSDQRASYSNFGNNIDVVVPIQNLSVRTTERVENGSYEGFGGTSAATPHVTGLAALLRSVNASLHPEDIENIIQISAERVGPYTYTNGYSIHMGNGRINAGQALLLLRTPWQFAQRTSTGGTIYSSTGSQQLTFTKAANNPPQPASGTYIGKRHEVRKTVTIPNYSQYHAWGRGAGASTGWSGANPNFTIDYCDIVSRTPTTVTLRTFVYYIERTVTGSAINQWYPCSPSQVVFAYTTLGIPGTPPVPLSANITGPTSLNVGQSGTWSANASGGNGSYTYTWFLTTENGIRTQVSTSSSFSRTMRDADISFNIELRVSSGGATVVDYHYVNCLNCNPCNPCRTITISPNPVKDKFKVTVNQSQGELAASSEFKEPEERIFVLYNSQGQLVYQTQSGNSAIDIEANELTVGVYILHVYEKSGLTTEKILIDK